MKKVHSAPHPFALENFRNVLGAEGIEAEVRTPFLGAARGDIPATECWSELWVIDDDQAARARELIAAASGPVDESGDSWKCGGCGEVVEPQFAVCWQCGRVRTGGHV